MQQLELKKYDSEITKMEELVNDYKDLIVTRENVKEADKARLALKNWRLSVQRIEKDNNEIIKELSKLNKERAADFLKTIPIEDRLQADIKKIEAEIENERIAEQRRVDNCKSNIDDVYNKITIAATCNDVKLLKSFLELEMPQDIAEFEKEWLDAKNQLTSVVNQRLDYLALVAAEEKRKEEERQREVVEANKKQQPDIILTGNSKIEPVVKPAENSNHNEIGHFQGTVHRGPFNIPGSYDTAPKKPIEEVLNNKMPTLSVMANFFYGQYKFHIDPSLNEATIAEIKSKIENILDNLEF